MECLGIGLALVTKFDVYDKRRCTVKELSQISSACASFHLVLQLITATSSKR